MHLVNVGFIANSEFLLNEKRGAESAALRLSHRLRVIAVRLFQMRSLSERRTALTLKGSK